MQMCWQVMHQDLAGGKYYRKKGKASSPRHEQSEEEQLARKKTRDEHGQSWNANEMMCHGGVCQVVRVRQQFAAEIRMVEGRPFWDEEPGKIM